MRQFSGSFLGFVFVFMGLSLSSCSGTDPIPADGGASDAVVDVQVGTDGVVSTTDIVSDTFEPPADALEDVLVDGGLQPEGCEVDEDCVSEQPCLTGLCDLETASCSYEIVADACFVDETCYLDGAVQEEDLCLYCASVLDSISLQSQQCPPNQSCESSSGECRCDDGYEGEGCETPICETACSDNGSCTAPNVCTCLPGFAGDDCSAESSAECNDKGVVNTDGDCECSAGYSGPACEFSDDLTCFGHGTALDDGACLCDEGFSGDSCDTAVCTPECGAFGQCVAPNECACGVGYGGPTCEPLVEEACNGGGIPNAEGGCDCTDGFDGVDCAFSDALSCSDHGEVQWDGTCLCDLGYGGSDCAECVNPMGCVENLNQPFAPELSSFTMELGSCWAMATEGSLGPDEYLECDTSAGSYGAEAIAWSEEISTEGGAEVYVQLNLAWTAPEEGVHSLQVLASSNLDDPSKMQILKEITVNGVNAGEAHVVALSPVMAAQASVWIGVQVDTDGSGTVVASFDDVMLATDSTDFGCVGQAESTSCALPQGTGSCLLGDCLVTECGAGYYDLNAVHEDGCEYACFGTPGDEEACNGLDDDCDGEIDEECTGNSLDDSWFGGLISNVVTWGDVTANTFEIGAEGVFHGGPLGDVVVTGTVSQDGATAPVVWCFTGAKSFNLLGLSFSDVSVEVCRDSEGLVTTVLNGFVMVEGVNAEFTGTLDFDNPWKLVFQIEDLPLAGSIVLNKAKFTVSKGGSQFNLSANLNLGTAEDPVELKVSGAYYTTGTLNLNLALEADSAWSPIPGNSLSLTAVTGKLKRKVSGWNVELDVEGSFPLTIAPGLGVDVTSFGGSLSSSGDWSFHLGGDVEMGPLGTVTLEGSLAKGNDEVPLYGCLSATKDQNIFGLQVDSLSVEACVTEAGAQTITLSGDAIFGGEIHPFTGSVEKIDDIYNVTLSMGNLTLAPGVVLNNVVLSASTGATAFGLSADMNVQDMNFVVSGNYTGPENFDLSLSATNLDWQPFDMLDLSFTSASGSISRAGDLFEFEVQTAAQTEFTVIDGLTITGIYAMLNVDTEGNYLVGLGGNVSITLGETNATVSVIGAADNEGKFSLVGTLDGELQPLEGLIGEDRFTMSDTNVGVEWDSAGYAVTFGTTATICYELGGCTTAKPPFVIEMDGAIVDSVDFWFRGNLPEYELPGFGVLPNITVMVASNNFKDLDILNTPDDESDDEDIEEGITLIVTAESPLPLFEEVETLQFFFNLKTLNEISIKAKMGLDWELFGPDVIPTIDYLKLTGLFLKGKIEGSEVEIGFGAETEFLPSNQEVPMEGTAEFSVDNTGAAEITMFLEGRWIEPFGLDRFAVQNPGFTVEALFSTGIPVPSSLGLNGDIFWQKPGTMEWPPESDALEDAPEGILKLGGTIFYDKAVTQSGLCLVKPCPSMPPFLFRLDIQNLSPSDTIAMVNDLRKSLFEALGFGDFLPDEDIASAELFVNEEPTEAPMITFHTLKFYASTHNKIIFGQKWNAGFKVEIDATVLEKDVYFRGELSRKGLVLQGEMDPFSLDAGKLFNVQVMGDPYRKYAALGGSGSIAVSHDTYFNLFEGTYEGWIKASQFIDFPLGSVLVEKGTEGGGFAIGFGSPDESGAKVSVGFHDGDAEYLVTTDEGLLQTDTWHHIAVNFKGGDIAVFVDGELAPSTGTGVKTAAAFNSGTMHIGAGLAAVDDVRVWNVIRTRDQIAGNARMLPMNYHYDGELVARYEFDYEEDSSTTAHNGRQYQEIPVEPIEEEIPGGFPGIPGWPGGGIPALPELHHPLHGTLSGGAAITTNMEDQDLYFKLVFTFPSQGESNGLWLQAGMDLEFPIADMSLAGKAKVRLGDGQAFGELYLGDFNVLPIPFLGTFFLSGDGPNMFPNDFDDGLYAAFDLKELMFMATGNFGFTSSVGDEDENILGGAMVSFMCPPGKLCEHAWDHVFDANGFIDLTTDLPGGFGEFGLEGEALYNSTEGRLWVSGSVKAFDRDFLSGSIELTSSGLLMEASMDMAGMTPFDLGSLTMGLGLDFEGPTLCGNTALMINVPLIEGEFDGLLELCLGAEDSLLIDATASELTFFGFGLENATLYYNSISAAAEISADINLPIWSGSLYASYDGEGDITFMASSDLTVFGYTLAEADLSLSSAGFYVSGMLDLLGSGVSVSGSYKPTGDWMLSGTGTIGLGSYELADASVSLSNHGLEVTSKLNLGPLDVDLTGTIGTDGSYSFTGSQDLTIAGYTLTEASVTLSNTEGLRVQGLVNVLGSVVEVSGSVTPSGQFSLTGEADINLLFYPIANATITLNNSKLKVAGILQMLGASVAVDVTVNSSGTFTAMGMTDLTVSGYTIANAFFTLTNSKLTLNGMMQAGPFIQANVAGSITPFGGTNISGSMDIAQFGDYQLADVDFSLNDSGLSASATLDVGLIDASVSGSIGSDGSFNLMAVTTITVPLYDVWGSALDDDIKLFSALVSLSSEDGLRISANAHISNVFDASFDGGVTPNGSFRLDASAELTFPQDTDNWVMGSGASASISIYYCKEPYTGVCAGFDKPTFSGGGKIEVSGEVDILSNTITLEGHIRPKSWSISATHSLNFGSTSYKLLNSNITLGKSSGLEVSSSMQIPSLLDVSVTGIIRPNGTFVLSTAAGVTFFNTSWSPAFSGKLGISGFRQDEWPYYAISASASVSFSFHGQTASGSFSVDSSGDVSFWANAHFETDMPDGCGSSNTPGNHLWRCDISVTGDSDGFDGTLSAMCYWPMAEFPPFLGLIDCNLQKQIGASINLSEGEFCAIGFCADFW